MVAGSRLTGVLESLLEPQIDQCFRRQPATLRQGGDLGVDLRVERHAMATFRAHGEIRVLGRVPIIGQAVRVPELGQFVQRLRVRDRGLAGIVRMGRPS